MKIKRIPTGIGNLDKLIEGGFEDGGVFVLTGKTGSLKSTFARQFLVEGAKRGEKTLYFTCEESKEAVIKSMKLFGWNLNKLNIIIKQISPFNYKEAKTQILNFIKEIMPDRIVIDSVTNLLLYAGDSNNYPIPEMKVNYYVNGLGGIRKKTFEFVDAMAKLDSITVLLIAERGTSELNFVSEIVSLLTDGVLNLGILEYGNNSPTRILTITKMRRTAHDLGKFPLSINTKGISINEPSADLKLYFKLQKMNKNKIGI